MRPSPAVHHPGSAAKIVGPFACKQGVSQDQYVADASPSAEVPGVWVRKGVRLEPAAKGFAAWLESVWPFDFPVVITRSAVTPRAQAKAMLDNFRRNGGGAPGAYPLPVQASYPGGVKYLYGLYSSDDIVGALLRAPQSESAWAEVIATYLRKGRALSGHIRLEGDAVDVRCWNMTEAMRQELAKTIESVWPGAEVLLESDHIHVEGMDNAPAVAMRDEDEPKDLMGFFPPGPRSCPPGWSRACSRCGPRSTCECRRDSPSPPDGALAQFGRGGGGGGGGGGRGGGGRGGGRGWGRGGWGPRPGPILWPRGGWPGGWWAEGPEPLPPCLVDDILCDEPMDFGAVLGRSMLAGGYGGRSTRRLSSYGAEKKLKITTRIPVFRGMSVNVKVPGLYVEPGRVLLLLGTFPLNGDTWHQVQLPEGPLWVVGESGGVRYAEPLGDEAAVEPAPPVSPAPATSAGPVTGRDVKGWPVSSASFDAQVPQRCVDAPGLDLVTMQVPLVSGGKATLRVHRLLGPVFAEFLAWFAREIEPIDSVGSFCHREIRGREGTGSVSYHAAGAAIDINAVKHPLGRSGTFTSDQAQRIRAKSRELGLKWGGDYQGRKDDMHWEPAMPPAEFESFHRARGVNFEAPIADLSPSALQRAEVSLRSVFPGGGPLTQQAAETVEYAKFFVPAAATLILGGAVLAALNARRPRRLGNPTPPYGVR